jgi:hypothetical protein
LQKALIKKAGFESQISELKEFAAKEKLEIVQPACWQAGRQVRKDRFCGRAEGGSGGSASWKMRHFAPSLASIYPNFLI